jgi:hypothetical protein
MMEEHSKYLYTPCFKLAQRHPKKMIDWLYSFGEETKKIIERTNQLKKENERLRKETEALRSVTPEKLSEIVKKSVRKTPDKGLSRVSTTF